MFPRWYRVVLTLVLKGNPIFPVIHDWLIYEVTNLLLPYNSRHNNYLLLFYSLSTLWKHILFLDILLESDFIQQFVVLVPKIVIWCDMTMIVHKMKMEYNFLKLLRLTKSFIVTNLWSTIVLWKFIKSVYFFHNQQSVWGPCCQSFNIF